MEKLNLQQIEARHEALRAGFEPIDLVMILDNVRSALNVGAVFRTADVFALKSVWLCGITAQPPNREVLKTALGATDTVAWTYYPQTVEAITAAKSEGYTVLGLEQVKDSILLQNLYKNEDLFSNRKIAIVLGNEVEGVAPEALAACDAALEIPQFGSKHSLNVSVAAGIVAWEIQRLAII